MELRNCQSSLEGETGYLRKRLGTGRELRRFYWARGNCVHGPCSKVTLKHGTGTPKWINKTRHVTCNRMLLSHKKEMLTHG